MLAIVALVFSGVLLLLGIGQRTFLAGPAEIEYEATVSTDAGYAVIDGAELQTVAGQANVTAAGKDAFVATGATRDVQAWVEEFDHVALVADRGARGFVSEEIAGVAPAAEPSAAEADQTAPADGVAPAENGDGEDGKAEPLDPRGSDLWLQEKSASDSGSVRVPVKLDDDQSVIIATDGETLPKSIAVTWVQDRNTPWAGPMLVGGGVLALIGAVLYILAVDHDRRGLGPRRGRRGPLQGIRNSFSRKRTTAPAAAEPTKQEGGAGMTSARRGVRRLALPAAGVALAVGLTGCSASYWPQFDAGAAESTTTDEPKSSSAPLPVTATQIDRILDRIVEVSDTADKDLDAELLKERFTGDALQQRTANYAIRAAATEWLIPPLITTDELDYQLVQSTEGWPRTMLVTVASEKGGAPADTADQATDGEEASPSLALVMTQETPHDNYLVSSVIALRGGIAMPQAAPADEGTALLADDIESFLLQPGEVGTAFASVLQDGEASPDSELFDLGEDKILENSGKARVERLAADAEAKGKPMAFSVTARQGEEQTVALTTGVEGALVVTTVLEDQVVDGSAGRIKPVATGQVTALSGLSGQQERIVQTFAHQMLFFVPSKSDSGAKIQLLGDTSELIGAGN
ncbi:glycosyltransferase [Leucobacter sp. gxy201]|uniref:glycosyltransferase n=1 Tax=Leucobacter sp. gxy201 TaxID=2957200 RepID=UPI003DA0B8B2